MERLSIPKEYLKGQSTQNQRTDMPEEEPTGFIDPLMDCPQCKGAGFVCPVVNGKTDYSRMIPCKQKGCLGEGAGVYRQMELRGHSGITMAEKTFANFNASIIGIRKSFDAANKLADGDSDFIWLLIFGGVGNGKTHLMNAIAHRVLERGIEVKLVMMGELLSELRMAMSEHGTDKLIMKYKDYPYLLIDELGMELGTDWEQTVTDDILTGRWARGRFTAVATNLDVEALPERIKSRFKDKRLSKCVLNEAADYRLKGK